MNKNIAKVIAVAASTLITVLADILLKKTPGPKKPRDTDKNADTYVRLVSKVALADGLLSERELGIIKSGLPKKRRMAFFPNKLSRLEIESIVREEKNNPSDIIALSSLIVNKRSAEDIIKISAMLAFVDSDCTPEEYAALALLCEALKIDESIKQKYIDEAKK